MSFVKYVCENAHKFEERENKGIMETMHIWCGGGGDNAHNGDNMAEDETVCTIMEETTQ